MGLNAGESDGIKINVVNTKQKLTLIAFSFLIPPLLTVCEQTKVA